MSRYIDADYVRAVMINDRLMQGNAEFNLYAQQVEIQVNAIPSIDIVRCKECRWSRPRTLKGETGYRCVFYRIYKAENGHCDIGEREGV